jgi:hypothetical protein
MEKITDDSGFLFADQSFIGGAATTIDIGGTLVVYNVSRDGDDADFRALASDWAITGKDIKRSVEKFKKQTTKAKEKEAA